MSLGGLWRPGRPSGPGGCRQAVDFWVWSRGAEHPWQGENFVFISFEKLCCNGFYRVQRQIPIGQIQNPWLESRPPDSRPTDFQIADFRFQVLRIQNPWLSLDHQTLHPQTLDPSDSRPRYSQLCSSRSEIHYPSS